MKYQWLNKQNFICKETGKKNKKTKKQKNKKTKKQKNKITKKQKNKQTSCQPENHYVNYDKCININILMQCLPLMLSDPPPSSKQENKSDIFMRRFLPGNKFLQSKIQ